VCPSAQIGTLRQALRTLKNGSETASEAA
jgi:hypothetical protein